MFRQAPLYSRHRQFVQKPAVVFLSSFGVEFSVIERPPQLANDCDGRLLNSSELAENFSLHACTETSPQIDINIVGDRSS